MPRLPEQQPTRGKGIRLVRFGEPIQVKGNRQLSYFTTAPNFSDAGEVFLDGQGGTDLVSPAGRVAFTVRDGKLVTGDYATFARQGLFDISLTSKPGARDVRGYRHVVTMEIDGIDTTFTSILEPGEDTIEDRGRTHLVSSYAGEAWASNNPQDHTQYILMASPEDTALLSSLSFSFRLIRSEQDIPES